MRLIFISDLHLSPNTIAANQKFYQLLEQWYGKIDGLYILGDFFDYWIGDDDENQFTKEISSQFAKFSKLHPIYFRGGNHDFALGKIFAKKSGIHLIPDLHTIKVEDKTILLSHGDTFCTLDIGYQKLKSIIQNPIVMFILKKIPLSWRYKLKELLEKKSHTTHNMKPEHYYMVVNETIHTLAKQSHANIVIHGHTHRPGCYTSNLNNHQITRYEIPDWQDNPIGGYIELFENKINIIQ